MAGGDLIQYGEEPSREDRLSLREAAELFVPPKSRKAVEQLMYRGRLKVWQWPNPKNAERALGLYTTRAWLLEYIEDAPRGGKLRPVGEEIAEKAPENPQETHSGEEALHAVISDLAQENAALRVRIAQLESWP